MHKIGHRSEEVVDPEIDARLAWGARGDLPPASTTKTGPAFHFSHDNVQPEADAMRDDGLCAVCVEVGWVRCLMCATSALITNRPMAATAYNEQRFAEAMFPFVPTLIQQLTMLRVYVSRTQHMPVSP